MPDLALPPPDLVTPDPPGEGTVVSDADRLAHQPPTTCLNCGAVLPGQFCPDCVQRDQPIRQPAHVFIGESVSEYFGLDGRLWRSLGLLLFRPGVLTEAYLDGRRTRYLRPLRLYLTATLLFFFLLSLLDPLQGGTLSITLDPVRADTTLTAADLAERLDERGDVYGIERDAVLSAAVLLPGLGRGDSLRALAADLAEADTLFQAWEDSLDAFPEDSLVAVSSLPVAVASALADTGRVEVSTVGQGLIKGIDDSIPEWAKGRLAQRLEATESPAERRLLTAQYQRAVVQQVPTALFLVLPLFALLLKLFFVAGAGTAPRHRPRPAPPAPDAPWWRQAAAQVTLGWWTVGRWREARRVRRRRKKLRLARRRRIRGAVRRLRGVVWSLPSLRPWRVRRLRQLRAAVRNAGSPYYSEHLVFGLHVHAFTFLVGAALLIVTRLGGEGSAWVSQMQVVLALSIPTYFLFAQKRVYRQSWPRTVLKATGIAMMYTVIVSIGTLVAAGLALRLS